MRVLSITYEETFTREDLLHAVAEANGIMVPDDAEVVIEDGDCLIRVRWTVVTEELAE